MAKFINKTNEAGALQRYYWGFFVVVLAGSIWSFGAVLVRYMVDSTAYQMQYLFYRGLAIAIILCIYLCIKEGVTFYKNFKHLGLSGLIGAIALTGAMLGFITSITITTAAVTLIMLSLMPFITACLSYIFIKESIRPLTIFSMFVSIIGVAFMVQLGGEKGSLLGLVLGLLSAVGFSIFTVTLRWRKDTPKFTTVSLAGFLCMLITLLYLLINNQSLAMPTINIYLSLTHGAVVATGLILYSLGAKYLPAAELALLSLMEVVGGIFWVWLPFLGIHEVPSNNTIIGGFIIILAVLIHGIGARKKHIPPLH